MKHSLLLFVLVISTSGLIKAQLPDGSIAPDWTHNDIYGNTHHLYSLLNQGKMVVIEFSATWCGPCWNYMLTGALEDFWEEHGPNGTNEAQVFYIEADQNTGMDDLLGLTGSSQGNWVEAIPFPIIDLQVGENTDDLYDINYYPTLYAVCSDQKIYELGQVSANEWEEFIQSCLLAAEVSELVQAECYGEGSITIEATGGINPITYNWSNGESGPTLDNLGAGTYSVTVTEGNGREVEIEDIVVTGAEAPISLASSSMDPATCFGTPTGSVTVEIEEGVPPYDYDWSNGAQTQNLVNVAAGTYTLDVTDANGCTFTDDFEVTEPDELLAEYETTPDYCDQSNGTVALDIQGGVGGYEVSASAGSVFGNEVVDLPAGNVTVTIEDNNGCIWEESIEIEFTPEHELYFSPNPQITCVQPTTNVTGYVVAGSGEYEFEWSTTNGHIVGPTNLATVTVDQQGDYDLNVYDVLTGCDVTSSIEVLSTVDPPAVTAGDDTPISCEVLQPVLQGTGDPANTIQWSTPNGNIVSGANTYTPTVDMPGLYIIQVTNPVNSCTNVDSVAVLNQINPATAAYQIQTSSLTMIGTDMSTGSNVSGWNWNFGDGNTSTEPNVVHTYAAAGTYQVCLSVQNGCGVNELCQQVEVTFTGSVITVAANITNVLCNSDSTGNIILLVNGGSGTYTFTWTGPDGTIYTTQNLDNVPAGIYQLVVSDDQGNVFIGEFTVTEPPAIIVAGSTVVDNLCFGQTNGSITIDVTGGVGPYLYSFNGGPTQSENFLQNLPGGTVECVITDANGCSFTAGLYTIQEPADIAYEAHVAHVRCYGDSNGSITLVINGGTAPYTYLWNDNQTTTPDISQLAPGQYSCVVTDHNGCIEQVVALEISQPDSLLVTNVNAVNPSNLEHNDGSITLDIQGGTAPYTVTWSNGATGTTITGLVPGMYLYTITDANGCTLGITDPIVLTGPTATYEIDLSSYVTITPNPSNGNVMVKWEGLDFGKGQMTLLTLEGQRIQSRTVSSADGQWDLSGTGLASGIYVVLLEMNQQAVPFKLVVL